MSLALSGIGVSRGIAIGKAHIMLRGSVEVHESAIPDHLLEDEVSRFLSAVEIAREQLRATRRRIPEDTRADIAAFIDTHLLMLDDATIVKTPVELIRSLACNAEWALKLQRDSLVVVFEQMDDAYLRTRRDDVDHVINRILRILLDTENSDPAVDETGFLRDAIVITNNLTPAETVMLEHQGVSGFATEYGGPLSHTAILARSMQVPAIVGVHSLQNYISDGETLILDGLQGVLITGTDEAAIRFYRNKQADEQRRLEELARLSDLPAVTLDGVPVTLMCNIETPEDIKAVSSENSGGVGLYRTEFLFMNRREPPDEEEQYQTYRHVIDLLGGKPLTIRTLDTGADKDVDSVSTRACHNPALGLRAIRLCLKDLSLFRPQLRAILRASAHGPVKLMIPMLSTAHEMHQVLTIINDVKNSLLREDLAFSPDISIGGMIEVPAAALVSDMFSRHLDFLSIGTNDLIQYTLAIDRVDDEVNYLYDPLHPAVLRLIRMVIDAGSRAGIPVGMCGEMAGDPGYTRLLLGMGLREFSMHHTALQEVKQVINNSSAEVLSKRIDTLLNSSDPSGIHLLVEELNEQV